MKSMVVPAKVEYLDQITAFVSEQLEENDCPMKAQMQVEVAIEEIFVNIASYAYAPIEGEPRRACSAAWAVWASIW